MAKAYANHLIPLQTWELDAVAASGLTISQLRFTLSFFLSIPVAIVLRLLPTPKSELVVLWHWCQLAWYRQPRG